MRSWAHYVILSFALLLGSGCMPGGFQTYKPFQTGKYDNLLEPAAGTARFWVRGETSGDLDGDTTEDLVILATLHDKPTTKDPGPFSKVVLLLGSRDKSGVVDLRLRRTVFIANKTFAQAKTPPEVFQKIPAAPMRHCAAQILDVDGSGNGVLLVSVWSDEKDGAVIAWHQLFSLQNANQQYSLAPLLTLRARQRTATITPMDLNRDGKDELVVPQLILPGDGRTSPEWVSVYQRQADGTYAANNPSFPKPFQQRMLEWYRHYVRTLHTQPAEHALALHDYYLALMHLYTGDDETARRLAEHASQSTTEPLHTRALQLRATLKAKTAAAPGKITAPQLP